MTTRQKCLSRRVPTVLFTAVACSLCVHSHEISAYDIKAEAYVCVDSSALIAIQKITCTSPLACDVKRQKYEMSCRRADDLWGSNRQLDVARSDVDVMHTEIGAVLKIKAKNDQFLFILRADARDIPKGGSSEQGRLVFFKDEVSGKTIKHNGLCPNGKAYSGSKEFDAPLFHTYGPAGFHYANDKLKSIRKACGSN